MEPVQAAELVAPMVQLTLQIFYIMRATNAGFIVIFNKFAMYDWVLNHKPNSFCWDVCSYGQVWTIMLNEWKFIEWTNAGLIPIVNKFMFDELLKQKRLGLVIQKLYKRSAWFV